MNCHYCGTQLKDGDTFCLHCGTRQQNVPQAQPENVPAVQAPVQEVSVQVAKAPKTPATVYKEKDFGWQPYGAPEKEEPLVDLRSEVSALQLPVKRSL